MTSSTSNMALSAMVVADVSALLMPDGSLVTPLPTGVSKAQILAAIDELEERANDTELALARARHEASHKGSAHERGASNVRAMSEIVQEVFDDNREKAKASLVAFGALGEPLIKAAIAPLFQLPCDVPGYEENKRKHAVGKFTLARLIGERRRAVHESLAQLSAQWQSLYKAWTAEHNIRPVTSAPPPAALLHEAAALSGATETARIALGRASSTAAAAAAAAVGATDPAQAAAAAAQAAAQAAAVVAAAAAAVKSDASGKGDSKSKENKYMATVVDVPMMVLDASERERRFLNENNLVADPVAAERERKARHPWSNEEKRIFIKKYLMYPKQFHKIATFLENRSTADVIEFYFTHKLTFNLKRLLTEHQLKRRRRGDELEASGGRRSSMGGSSTAVGNRSASKGAAGAVQVVTLDSSSNAVGSPYDDGAAKRKREDDDTGGVAKKRPD
jgi:nuclear receptor co-repressor 1